MKNEKIEALAVYPWGDCNLACSYCGYRHSCGSLKESDFEKALVFLKKNYPSFRKITFLGGEPLLNFPRLKKLLYCARRIMPQAEITVFTNGTLLSRQVFSFMERLAVKLIISLDGLEEINDLQRKSPLKNQRISLKILSRISGRAEKLSFSMVVTPENVRFLVENTRKLFELGAGSIGWNLDYSSKWSRQDISALKSVLTRLRLYYLKLIKEGCPYRILNRYELLSQLSGGEFPGCSSVSLFPDGKLYACDKLFAPKAKTAKALLDRKNLDLSRKKFFERLSRLGFAPRGLLCPAGIYCHYKFVKCLKGRSLSIAVGSSMRLAALVEKEERKSLGEFLKYSTFRKIHNL